MASILLGSVDPERLRSWYSNAFDCAPDPQGYCVFGDIVILFEHRDDVTAQNDEPGRYILNFHVDDAHAAAAHLRDLGVQWLVPLEERPDGWFGTLVDPDGNYVQIIQMRS